MDRTMPNELVSLQRRVEAWRAQGGGHKRRIPEELWDDAVSVARTAGLSSTARALRFGYQRLKMRADRAARTTPTRKTEFVAFSVPSLPGGTKLVVDLVGRDGEQMRIDVSGASAMDTVALVEAFWRRRS
jgi:hypothetical protein